MKTIIKNIFVLTLILALFSSCSKFEDGPKISLRSIEKRIYGTYRIEYFSKNGTDLTSYWNQYYDLDFIIKEISPADIGDHIGMETKGYIDSCGFWKYYKASLYSLNYKDDSTDPTIYMFNYVYDTSWYPDRYIYPLIVDVSTHYNDPFHITRLTMDELWLNHSVGNDYYEIHFKEEE